MTTIISTRTEASLQEVKFADLATIYNIFARELGQKELKKFRDKTTGIARILKIQAEFVEANKSKERDIAEAREINRIEADSDAARDTREETEQTFQKLNPSSTDRVNNCPNSAESAPATKNAKSRTDMETTIQIVSGQPKEGSIGDSIYTAVGSHDCDTVGKVVDWMLANYTKPRSNLPVSQSFVVGTINWFVNKGDLELGA